jgi:hypothetical protein
MDGIVPTNERYRVLSVVRSTIPPVWADRANPVLVLIRWETRVETSIYHSP